MTFRGQRPGCHTLAMERSILPKMPGVPSLKNASPGKLRKDSQGSQLSVGLRT